MRMMLSDPTGQIERECAMPEMRQRDVASTYGLAIRDESHVRVDWGRVNAAIMRRWPKGLARVKKMAWDMLKAHTLPEPSGSPEPLRPSLRSIRGETTEKE